MMRFWSLYVFLTGAAVMMLEFAAARVVAPWFGSSMFVWGNVVGVVLLALSLGYYYGGRLADRHPDRRYLTGIVYAAGMMTALIPWLLSIFTAGFSLLDLQREEGFIFFTIVGSFFMIVLLFAVPVGLLGMVSPFVLRLAMREVQTAGTVAGGLYAWSTIGSIVGTFVSAFFFVPVLGSRETIVLSAVALLIVAWLGYRQWGWVLLSLLFPLLTYIFFRHALLRADASIIVETESPYQFIQVRDAGDRLVLLFNEGLGTQSYYMKEGVLTGSYYDYLALVPALVQPDEGSQPTALVLGLAGGTATRELVQYFPTWKLTGVELDPSVVEIVRQYFHIAEQPMHVVINDGRMFLRGTDGRFDVIIIDAFTNEYYIPWHMTTKEFFSDVATHLNSGGAVAMNIGTLSQQTKLFRALIATLQEVFAHVYTVNVPDSFNVVVIASQQKLSPNALNEIGDERLDTVHQLNRTWTETKKEDEARVLTDNRAPIELYTEGMVLDYLWGIRP